MPSPYRLGTAWYSGPYALPMASYVQGEGRCVTVDKASPQTPPCAPPPMLPQHTGLLRIAGYTLRRGLSGGLLSSMVVGYSLSLVGTRPPPAPADCRMVFVSWIVVLLLLSFIRVVSILGFL